MFGVLGALRGAITSAVERRRYAGVYRCDPGDLDLDAHLREAAAWLVRAQDAGTDRGVSYGAHFGGPFLPSYPETTGYIIPTFLRLARVLDDPAFRRRAREMGDWEIGVQMPCGAVMGGMVTEQPTPAVFNTGQVLLGWAALACDAGDTRYLEAGRRAAEWLTGIQEPDGSWRAGNSRFAHPGATVYNVAAAWGLYALGDVTGDERYEQAALRNAAFARSRQEDNGWFRDCCLSQPAQPLLHTIAYAMQGLLELGLFSRHDELVDAARRTADSLVGAMAADGSIPGRLRPDFSPAVAWTCLTGSAQTSVVLSRLAAVTGHDRYRDAALRINRYLMAHHDVRSSDPVIRGGVAGSWPVDGEYGRYMVLNWATKFLVDALLEEREEQCARPSPSA